MGIPIRPAIPLSGAPAESSGGAREMELSPGWRLRLECPPCFKLEPTDCDRGSCGLIRYLTISWDRGIHGELLSTTSDSPSLSMARGGYRSLRRHRSLRNAACDFPGSGIPVDTAVSSVSGLGTCPVTCRGSLLSEIIRRIRLAVLKPRRMVPVSNWNGRVRCYDRSIETSGPSMSRWVPMERFTL